MNHTGNPFGEKKFYSVLLLLIVGLAAYSSAMNELNQLQRVTLQASELLASWSDNLVPTASASAPVVAPSCVETVVQNASRSDEFRWNGNVAPGSAVEVKNINGEIVADLASGSEVQVIAQKRARKSDVNSVQIKVVPHAGGVTICALYPTEDGGYTNCGSGDSDEGRKEGSNTIRNNDVSVEFTVHIPASVNFVGKSVNGGISVSGLNGNVDAKTVNGSIKISTSGYAEAATVNGEISAKLGTADWPKALSFKTVNGGINLDLPAGLGASVEAQTLNGSINSDFPLTITEQKGKKHIRGTIGAGGRDLMLKTLNGSINLRIAG